MRLPLPTSRFPLTPTPLHSSLALLFPVLLVQDSTSRSNDTARSGAIALPVLGYSGKTGLQYGATAFRSFRVGGDARTRSSSDAIYIAHTAEGHTKAYLQIDRWSAGNGRELRGRIEHQSYPLPYFGIGASAPDTAEEWYSHRVTTLHLFGETRVARGTWIHTGYRFIHTRRREVEPDGALVADRVAGTRGGVVSELRLGLTRDTRDRPIAPRSGTFARVVAGVATSGLASDFAFRRISVDARRYHAFAGAFAVAGQVQLDIVQGEVPFDQLPMIGADSAMRGYPRGRYRDRNAATAQVELRTPYWRRAGFVFFAGAGAVAPDPGAFGAVAWQPSAGLGLRFLLRPQDRSTARLDIAIGRGTIGAHIGLGEAF